MPRLPDEFLTTTAIMFADEESADDHGMPGGVACLLRREVVRHPDGLATRLTFVITNSHVISNGGHWAKFETPGGTVTVEIPPERWVHADKDDLAVGIIEDPAGAFDFSGVSEFESILATDDRMYELNIGYGDDVVAVGAGGEANAWAPIMRFGNIASWPITEMTDGRPEFNRKVELLMVEMRSRGGDSGSPVFVWVPPGSPRGNGMMMPWFEANVGLLGIVCGHLRANDDANRNSNVSLVVPYRGIHALLDHEETRSMTAAVLRRLP